MTAEPPDPLYLDEAAARADLTDVFDRCAACADCVDLCATFPLLSERLARRAAGGALDAGRLTPADQDDIVDSCLLCDRCVGRCDDVHVPNAVMRMRAMSRGTSHRTMRAARTDALLGRPDRLARLTRAAPFGRRLAHARPNGLARRVMAAATGISAVRVLPPYARERFSTWLRRRPAVTTAQRVALLPTCLVEYHEPAIGRDLVEVYARNGIGCVLSTAGCCGAAALHTGDHARFRALAERNVAALRAPDVDGLSIVVPQPTCRSVIVEHYPRVLGGPGAADVAARVVGAAEPLLAVDDAGAGAGLDTRFADGVPARITMHVACHAVGTADADRRLLERTGAAVTTVAGCSGSGGAWGLRAGHEDVAVPLARRLAADLASAGGDVVVGGCHAANTAVTEQTGDTVTHPIQVLARAYGITST